MTNRLTSPRQFLVYPLAAMLAACASTSNADKTASADGPNRTMTNSDPGVMLRTYPNTGTRYLTSVGMPNTGPVTLPDWVVNPTLDGVLGAIGVASRNELGTSHQIENARASGRLEIARMLEVRVQEVGRRDIEQRLVVGQGELQDQGSRKSLLGVDRSIADMVLAGSRQRALWFDPTTGDCYLWVVMDGAVKTKADHSVENGVSVYIANQPVTKEFRPERPKPVEPPKVQPPEPEPMGPIEALESRLKPIETIPLKTKGASKPEDTE
jgi:hypothetical protein